MRRTAFLIMVIMVISKIFGFAKQLILAYYYGASSISDAYLISITIPNVIFGFIGAAIVAGFIPKYYHIFKKSEDEAESFTNNFYNILIVLTSIIVLVSLIFTKEIVQIFASGFNDSILRKATLYTRISILSLYSIALYSLLKGYLQTKNLIVIASFAEIPSALILIVSIFLASLIGDIILPIGFLFASGVKFLIVLHFSKKSGLKRKIKILEINEDIKDLGKLSIPMIIGISVNQVNTLVDRTIASQIVVGGISSLNYATSFTNIVEGIFIASIVTVIYPELSKRASENEFDKFKKTLKESVNMILFLVIPSTIGLAVLSNSIIRVVYGRGSFDEIAINLTSYSLFFYSIGLTGVGLRSLLLKAFYSIRDTNTPMINATVGVFMNILLNIILSKFYGIGGLALATSISATFTTILLFISLRKKIGPLGMKQISISFLKILFASLVMGLLAKLSFDYLTSTLSQNLSLLIAIGVGVVSYFVIIYFMKIEDVDVIVGAIKKKLGRGAA
jgi:putative peptidoglycan lipid II flippase